MSPPPNGQHQEDSRERSAAYARCLHELNRPDPDYQAAQLYATLSLEEALRDMATELASLGRKIDLSLRRL